LAEEIHVKRETLLKDGDHFVVLEEGEFHAERVLQEEAQREAEVEHQTDGARTCTDG
jgi:hypothetical protein